MNLEILCALVNANKVRCSSALAVLVSLVFSPAAGRHTSAVRPSTSEVTVQVSIFEAKFRQQLNDKSGVAVWLVSRDNFPKPSSDTPQPHYRMMQHHKMFEPHLLVVPAGSVVEFPNLDPWFHNAFSISSSGRFDLGLYPTGARKWVKFDHAGASYVFCRIHPEMAAVVLTVDSSYFGVSDPAGHISISNVPRGRYLVHVWYEDATREALEALESPVVVLDERTIPPAILVVVAKQGTLRATNQR